VRGALAACRRALDARPASAPALTLLAETELTRGRGREALRLATAATTADPAFADAYVIIGGVHQDAGRDAEARAAYRRYLAIAPRGRHAADLRAVLTNL
jgi:tetratricopeptide (TPR) repeat protein